MVHYLDVVDLVWVDINWSELISTPVLDTVSITSSSQTTLKINQAVIERRRTIFTHCSTVYFRNSAELETKGQF